MSPRIISFEGVDYTGKTETLLTLKNKLFPAEVVCNRGPIYPTELTRQLIELAEGCSDTEKEIIYATLFMMDKSSTNGREDARIVFQDRYWPSSIAYGRFLNGRDSIHERVDFRPLFLRPDAIVLFTCSLKEIERRSKNRESKSSIDRRLLEDMRRFKELELQIERSLEGLDKVYHLDTTHISVEEAAKRIASLDLI